MCSVLVHARGEQKVDEPCGGQNLNDSRSRASTDPRDDWRCPCPSLPLISFFTGLPARPLGPITVQAAVAPQCPNVSMYAVNFVRAWVSAPHAQMDTVSPASTDSLTGCAGLAANGAGPRRCTAGVTPASVRTRDRRTEARTGPGPLCPRNGRPHPGFPGVT